MNVFAKEHICAYNTATKVSENGILFYCKVCGKNLSKQ